MKSLEIKNVKKLMNDLFGGRAFDNFLVTQVKLSCMNNVEINGKINKSFLNEEEIEISSGAFLKSKWGNFPKQKLPKIVTSHNSKEISQ